jgi:hypothetical protein
MDNFYKELFDINDEEDARYYKLIPTIDVKIFDEILKKDIKIINGSMMKQHEWIKFKYELLKCEEKWKTQVFDWKIDKKKLNSKCPYLSININYDVLENKPSRYFQVRMAIENIWMCDTRLTNMWEFIDDAIECNSQ